MMGLNDSPEAGSNSAIFKAACALGALSSWATEDSLSFGFRESDAEDAE
jgi:hypothetical protein